MNRPLWIFHVIIVQNWVTVAYPRHQIGTKRVCALNRKRDLAKHGPAETHICLCPMDSEYDSVVYRQKLHNDTRIFRISFVCMPVSCCLMFIPCYWSTTYATGSRVTLPWLPGLVYKTAEPFFSPEYMESERSRTLNNGLTYFSILISFKYKECRTERRISKHTHTQ